MGGEKYRAELLPAGVEGVCGGCVRNNKNIQNIYLGAINFMAIRFFIATKSEETPPKGAARRWRSQICALNYAELGISQRVCVCVDVGVCVCVYT